MIKSITIVFIGFAISTNCLPKNNKLPEDFYVGFASAAYQIEGAWNEDGKGENVWDRTVHTRENYVVDNTTGDVAADSYHKYMDDVKSLKDLGAQFYRFSISWSRILPTGFSNTINQPGIEYYNKLINALLENNIQPMVTLIHGDSPQPLQDLGGFANPLMADWFEDYARIAFSNFGDRVKYWITFNEPLEMCRGAYGGDNPPPVNMPGTAEYMAAHTIILSHARVYHLYDTEFRSFQNGFVGITLNGGWMEPGSDSNEDIEAAERSMQFEVGWFAHPIFSADGDYPQVMRKIVDANSAAEGRLRSRLPVFDEATIDYIRGTYDFFGCNHYSTNLVKPASGSVGVSPSWNTDRNVSLYHDPDWPGSATSWLKVVPWGIRRQLNFIKNQYNNPLIIITENGFSDTGEIEDDNRIDYYSKYLQEVLNAIYEDGVRVKGYAAWSAIDNFEWRQGFTERFGIVHVDFDSDDRPRTWKKSAKYFQQLITERQLPSYRAGLQVCGAQSKCHERGP